MIEALALPVELTARDGAFTVRAADERDLDELIRLVANDPVSAARGDTAACDDRDACARGLAAIQASPGNVQVVAERDGVPIATLQLTLIPGLSRRGANRLQVETVRVREELRSAGIGAALMGWARDVAPTLDARIVQLTSDSARTDAHRFYARLGYARSHVGFKLQVGA